MKKLIYLPLLIALVSCSKVIEKQAFSSPDEKVIITFTGERSSSLDPWLVNINVKGYEYDETVHTEIYNSTLKNNIEVIWIGNNQASIFLKQTDGNDVAMKLQIRKGHIRLQ